MEQDLYTPNGVNNERSMQCFPCLGSDDAVNGQMFGFLETLDCFECTRAEIPIDGGRTTSTRLFDGLLDGVDEVRDVSLGYLAVIAPIPCSDRITTAGERRTGYHGGRGHDQASKKEYSDT